MDEMGSKKMKKVTRNLSLETNWDCGNREEEVGVHERGAVELLKLLQVQSIRLRWRGRWLESLKFAEKLLLFLGFSPFSFVKQKLVEVLTNPPGNPCLLSRKIGYCGFAYGCVFDCTTPLSYKKIYSKILILL